MRQTVKPIALLFFLSIAALPQSKSQHYEKTPYTEIVAISWGSRWDIHNTEKVPFSIDVKNIGTNKIVSVTWQHEILDKYREHVVIDRLTFQTNKEIKPGDTKHLSKRIDYSHFMDNHTAQVKVIKLRFADGSDWQTTP